MSIVLADTTAADLRTRRHVDGLTSLPPVASAKSQPDAGKSACSQPICPGIKFAAAVVQSQFSEILPSVKRML